MQEPCFLSLPVLFVSSAPKLRRHQNARLDPEDDLKPRDLHPASRVADNKKIDDDAGSEGGDWHAGVGIPGAGDRDCALEPGDSN